MADKKETEEGKMKEDNSNANQLGTEQGEENVLSTEISTIEPENTDVLPDVSKLPVEGCADKEGDIEDDRATIDTNSDTIETSPIHSVQSIASIDFEEPMTPVTDVSYKSEASKSQTGSGRVTPCSQSDHSMSMSSSEKSTPKKKRKSTEAAGRQIDFERQHGRSAVTGKAIKYPFRLGIQWKKGEKLEAMDYMHKWFPAKIREINPDTLSVLIHFDGWNQRFDEWVLMASDRIRPLIRHSERKERGKKFSKLQDYKVGDQVYAKWTDCKMYPAKVTAILPNGSYEVIFYDGFKKQVQPINLRQMPGDLKQKTFEINPVPAEVIKKTKIRKELVGGNESVERTRRSSEASTSSGFPGHLQISTPEIQPEPIQSRRSSEKKRSTEKVPGEKKSSRSKSKKVKMIPADLFKQSSIEGEDLLTQGLIQSEAAGTQTAYSDNIEVEIDDVKLENVSPTDVGCYADSSPQVPIATSTSSVPAPSFGPQVLPPKAFVVESDHNRYKCHFEGCNKGFRKEHLLEYHIKYYHMDGSSTAPPPTIQPFRKRRKTTSCTDSDSTPTGKRSMFKQRRHLSSESTLLQDIKTEVKEETDSISSPSTSHSMVPETGEISTQTTPIKGGDQSSIEETYQLIKDELGTKHHRSQSQDSNWTEDSSMTDLEGEECLKPDELVNCICDFYEENGLMIQCEVCMCWQHAGCFGITERTLPKTYVCFVCENPPGVRESTKHIHEQDWLKSGEIPSFTYLQAPPVSEERRNIIKATNSLVTDLHSLNTVLHSLKLQLKILRTKDEQKLKMWRLDWDVMEPFEDHTDQQEEIQDNTQQVKDESIVGQEQEMSLDIEHQKDISLDVKQEVIDVSELKGLVTPDVITGDRITVDKESNERKSECEIEIKQEVVDGVEVKDGGKDTSSSIIKIDQTESVIESDNQGKQAEGNTESTVKMETSADDTITKSSDKSLQSLSSNKSGNIVSDSGETAETEGGGVKEGIESSHDLNLSSEHGKTDQGGDPLVHCEMEFEEANHSDSTESAVEDPLEMCEKNLLSHIFRVQEEINHRMDQIEEQVALLEAVEAAQESKEPPSSQALFSDMPQLKRCMKMMHGDLNKVKKMSVFH